jgi:hypothetical protein
MRSWPSFVNLMLVLLDEIIREFGIPLNGHDQTQPPIFRVVTINGLEEGSRFHRGASLQPPDPVISLDSPSLAIYYEEYKIIGSREAPEEPKLEFRVHIVDLTSDDKDKMQIKSKHIPNPTMSDRRSTVFHIPIGPRIVYGSKILRLLLSLPYVTLFSLSQLLENERLLLVLADRDKYSIFLERMSEVDTALQRGRTTKTLHRSKAGEDFLFAFDEEKRMLAVCTSATVNTLSGIRWTTLVTIPNQLQLHAFAFDETFRTLQSQGSPIRLAQWYGQAEVTILHMSPVCGDEVVLVDSTMQVRIFSFVTMQFRWASFVL